MKLKLLISILFLASMALLSTQVWADTCSGTGSKGAASAACTQSTPFSYTPAVDTTYNINYTTDEHYVGTTFNPNSTIAVCKVTFQLTKYLGTLVGKTFTCGIYEAAYSDTLGTPLDTATVSGNDAWSATDVDFTFSTPVTCTTGHNYSIVIDGGGADTSNVAKYGCNAAAHAWSYGLFAQWKQDKTSSSATSTVDVYIKIWGQ
jgi:hypothetical protein